MVKKLALAFTTRDKTHLTERSIEPLQHPEIDLYWADGSDTDAGIRLTENEKYHDWISNVRTNVKGGADAAIVYALTWALQSGSPYVGLCESDVLLHKDWFGPTMQLFERGRSEDLEVGAVSARAYADRILCQRDGFALCHNLGAGHIIMTRQAARITLDWCRTHWTTENRRVFHQLSGLDIAKWWAFRGEQHMITLDWGIEKILAMHGLAALALTPSPCEMIGQDPSLAEQGLTLVTEPVEMLRNDHAFDRFATMTARIREGDLRMPGSKFCRVDDGSEIVFPHQLGSLGGRRQHGWHLKWQQGFGPFAFVAEHDQSVIDLPVAGPCSVFVGGGKTGGKFELVDTQSGYTAAPDLPPDIGAGGMVQLVVPGNVAYRNIRLTALTPGCIFYGLKVNESQPAIPHWSFDHAQLPPA